MGVVETGLELWATVAEAPRYEVSTWGRVRRELADGQTIDVASWPNRKGYELVSLEIPGRERPALRYVHRLVLAAFSRPPATGEQGNHDDGRKGNNTLDNLEWMTPAQNVAHALARGLAPRPRVLRTVCAHGHPLAGKWRRCHRCRRVARRRKLDGPPLLLELAGAAG